MSALILPFQSKAELGCRRNLEAFIDYCRNIPVFGTGLDFDSDEWPVRGQIVGERAEGENVSFSILGSGKGRRHYMAEPFKTFAKAYFRYSYGLTPARNSTFRLVALRLLEAALREAGGNVCISEATGHTFDRAAQIAKEHFAAPYSYGMYLAQIAAHCDEKHLVPLELEWVNPFRSQPSASVRVSSDAASLRAKRLPEDEAVYAIGSIFSRAEEPVDQIISSIVAVLFSAPDRIGEALDLPFDCEVEEKGQYGLRWFPEKGGKPMVKWVIPSMVEVVREAIKRLKMCTEPARQVARWYEENPGKLYLPPGTEHFRDQELISTWEVGIICGRSPEEDTQQAVTHGAYWCKKVMGLTPHSGGGGRPLLYRFSEVEQGLIGQLPAGFPIFNRERGMRFSDSLCIIRPNELAPGRCTIPCLVDRIGQNHMKAQLGGVKDVQSIFDRFGFKAADGSRLKLQTHQVRRLLNTMAQKGGMDPLDIAHWSGRKRPEQNAAYDYVTSAEMIATLRKLAEGTDDGHLILGPMDEISRKAPMSRAEFFAMVVPQAHTTDFGFCTHEFSMLPCQVHQDCINCQEHLICKGDKRQYGNTCKRLEETEALLEKAKNGAARDLYGADQWSRHQMMSANRLRQMKSIHEDAKIEDGTIVQLGPPKAVWDNSSGAVRPSEIRNAIEQRAEEDPEIAALRDSLVWG
ncbi:MAG: integrase [Magnetospirillum gryphiswaldense]|nr:integrase [Magnetospirillum gryphiswaldense]